MSKEAVRPVILVDGSSYLFRAYHALPPLTNAAGMPTGAIYGVLNMLRRLIKEENPRYVGVVFDAPGGNFRHEIFPDYKANRTEMPEDLAVQIKPLHAAISAMGLHLICQPGVEADDVIGSWAVQLVAQGQQVKISTGDKDFAQLVSPHISLTNTMTGDSLDRDGVIAKFGLPPEKIIDYLALMGDSVDNIPGIPNVGPKTALKWLSTYETLDNLISHAAEVTGKVGENLRAHLDKLPLYRQLVTIQQDLDLDISLEKLEIRAPDNTALRELFQTLEFRTWLKAIDAETPQSVAPKAAVNYALILDEAALHAWLSKIPARGFLAVDTETTGLDYITASAVGISLALHPAEAIYIPFGHSYIGVPPQLSSEQVFSALKPILANPKLAKIGHHIKYDLHIFKNAGLEVAGPLYDSMLESYILNSGTAQNLGAVSKKYLDLEVSTYESVAGKGAKQISFAEVPLEAATLYSAEDADMTLRLHNTLWPRLSPREQSLYENIEAPLIRVLLAMERKGVCIDVPALQAQSAALDKEIQGLIKQSYDFAGEEFNLDSPKQLQAILYEKLQLPILEKTPTGQPSTAEPVLAALAADYPLPALILRYRSLSKLKSTYTDKLPELVSPKTGRIHTSYHQAVVATGRLSSSDPNLQNIPIRTPEGRQIRNAFIAAPGYTLISADYSQIELRIMAHLSQDPGLIKAFKAGEDIHRFTAMEIFGVPLADVNADQRRKAKAINFGLIYGMSPFGLAKQLGIAREEAAQYMHHYFARYPKVKDYMEETRALAAQQGYVETLAGRRLYLPDIHAKGPLRQAAERAAINAPMQGTAADIIKKAMISLHDFEQEEGDNFRMLMQVHDELVFEVKTSAVVAYTTVIRDFMVGAGSLSVPLVVGIGSGPNWGDAH